MNTKLLVVFILVFLALLYWILPKTRLSRKFKMNVMAFYIMNAVGIAFGIIGIIVSFMRPDLIFERHYFELILMPILCIYVYTAIIRKAQAVSTVSDLYDEKQNLNMTQAAALTWPASIIIVFLLYAMYQEGILTGLVFFPFFLFFTFTFYSASTLYLFRTN